MEEPMHTALGISDINLRSMYFTMMLARTIDERMLTLNRAGKIPFMVSCKGHEAVQIGAVHALSLDTDWICPYYRDLAMVLSRGYTAYFAMLSAFARRDDPDSGGRQMIAHYGNSKRRILSSSSLIATQALHAVGLAYAMRLRGEKGVVLASCGDGATSQGDFHEACNFAGIHSLPVIFLVQNNRYAISVPLDKQVAGLSISKRADGYGFYGTKINGTDILQVYSILFQAVHRARIGGGPTLVEAIVPRLNPHSSNDDDTVYRLPVELKSDLQNDPLPILHTYLLKNGVANEKEILMWHRDIVQDVDEAARTAEAAPSPNPKTLLDYVYANDVASGEGRG